MDLWAHEVGGLGVGGWVGWSAQGRGGGMFVCTNVEERISHESSSFFGIVPSSIRFYFLARLYQRKARLD